MNDAVQLGRLLREVRRAGSPVARMRVLTRAWRTLERLSPDQRAKLAAEVGIDGAEDLVERIAGRHGRIKPAIVLQALEKVREAEPGQMRELFAGLRDPRRRRSILSRGLEALSERFDDDWALGARPAREPAPQETAPEPAPQEDPQGDSPPPPAAGDPPPESPPGQASAPEVVEAASPAPPVTPVAPPRAVEVAPPVETPLRPAIPVYRLGPTPPSPTHPEAAPLRKNPRARPPHRPAPEVAPAARESEPLAERLATAGRLVSRLRLLRELAPDARRADVQTLREILDGFGSGWARRRALDALLAARAPARLEDALTLVDELESPAARRWCLGTILEAWELSERSRKRLLARRRTPSAGLAEPAVPG